MRSPYGLTTSRAVQTTSNSSASNVPQRWSVPQRKEELSISLAGPLSADLMPGRVLSLGFSVLSRGDVFTSCIWNPWHRDV